MIIAENYILGSNENIAVVIGLDIEYEDGLQATVSL